MCRILALTVLLSMTACSPAGPECSGEDVIDLVKQIAADQLSKDAQLQYVSDPKTTTYDVRAIRTNSKNATPCECAAQLHFGFDLLPNLKQIRDTKPDTWASMISNNFTEAKVKEVDVDITYTGQMTDDKKNVYVEVKGLGGN